MKNDFNSKVWELILELNKNFYSNSFDKQSAIIITTAKKNALLSEIKPQFVFVERFSKENAQRFFYHKISLIRIASISESDFEKIQIISKGNPALIELIIGLSLRFEFSNIWHSFCNYPINLELVEADQVFGFLFDLAWEQILSELHRKILMILSLFPFSISIDPIAEILQISKEKVTKCLNDLYSFTFADMEFDDNFAMWEVNSRYKRISYLRLVQDAALSKFIKGGFVNYFVCLPEKYSDSLMPKQAEIENLILAIELAIKMKKWNFVLEHSDSINRFFWKSGYWPERLYVNRLLLEASRQTKNDLIRARILVQDLGFTFLRFEDLLRAEQYVKVGLTMFKNIRDATGEALATRHLAKVSLLMGEYEHLKPDLNWADYFQIARELYTESIKIRQKLASQDSDQKIAIADLKLDFGRLCWLWGRKCEKYGRATNDSQMVLDAKRLYNESISVTKEGIELFEEFKVLRGISKAYGNYGNAYKELAYPIQISW